MLKSALALALLAPLLVAVPLFLTDRHLTDRWPVLLAVEPRLPWCALACGLAWLAAASLAVWAW